MSKIDTLSYIPDYEFHNFNKGYNLLERGFYNPFLLDFSDIEAFGSEAHEDEALRSPSTTSSGQCPVDRFGSELEQSSSSNESDDSTGGGMDLAFPDTEPLEPEGTTGTDHDSSFDREWEWVGFAELVRELSAFTQLGESMPNTPSGNDSGGTRAVEQEACDKPNDQPAGPEIGSSPTLRTVTDVETMNSCNNGGKARTCGEEIMNALLAIQRNVETMKAALPRLVNKRHKFTVPVQRQAGAAAKAVRIISQLAEAAVSIIPQIERQLDQVSDELTTSCQNTEFTSCQNTEFPAESTSYECTEFPTQSKSCQSTEFPDKGDKLHVPSSRSGDSFLLPLGGGARGGVNGENGERLRIAPITESLMPSPTAVSVTRGNVTARNNTVELAPREIIQSNVVAGAPGNKLVGISASELRHGADECSSLVADLWDSGNRRQGAVKFGTSPPSTASGLDHLWSSKLGEDVLKIDTEFPLLEPKSVLPLNSTGYVTTKGPAVPLNSTGYVTTKGPAGTSEPASEEEPTIKAGVGSSAAQEYDEGDARGIEQLPEGSYTLMEIDDLEILTEQTHFCNICSKGFKRDANLRMHMRSHGGKYKFSAALIRQERPPKVAQEMVDGKPTRYSCPYVGCNRNVKHPKFQALKTMLCLKNHYRRSHCPKTLKCSICKSKQFSVVADLKTHEKHCGSDKWACSCGTTFSRKEKLYGHVSLFVGHVPVDASMALNVVSEPDMSSRRDSATAPEQVLQQHAFRKRQHGLDPQPESSTIWEDWANTIH